MKKIVACFCLALIGGVVIAKPNVFDPFRQKGKTGPTKSLVTSVGWQYGRANCGPVASPPIMTLAGCTACCSGAVIPTGPLNPGNVTDCIAYCNSVFPRTSTSGWWDWFL